MYIRITKCLGLLINTVVLYRYHHKTFNWLPSLLQSPSPCPLNDDSKTKSQSFCYLKSPCDNLLPTMSSLYARPVWLLQSHLPPRGPAAWRQGAMHHSSVPVPSSPDPPGKLLHKTPITLISHPQTSSCTSSNTP